MRWHQDWKLIFIKVVCMCEFVGREFMEMTFNFLNCSEGWIPFIYSRLPVGANPRSISTWEHMFDQLRGRLNSKGHKYISFGGHIVLLNSVLNSIPIFYLSFLKMPTKVVKQIVRIQIKFLWGGPWEDVRFIGWNLEGEKR